MQPIRVFLADDHELVRYGLRGLLEDEPDIHVVGEAADGDSAIERCMALKPDVLVLDLHMPGVSGVEVCQIVRDKCPETSVLVLTSFDQDEELFGSLSAGANGYLLKESRVGQVTGAIRSLAEGQAVFDAHVAARVIKGRTEQGYELGSEPLSARETEVLELMAKGLSNKEIGRTLWIGETTVKTHVTHILRKLEQSDRTQAVLAAVRAGIIRLTP